MALRDYLFHLVTTDAVINALGITAANAFTSNDAETPQMRPFLVFRFANTTPGIPGEQTVNDRSFQVWVHDDPNDYTRIDDVITRVRSVLTSVFAQYTGTEGQYIHGVEWMGDSEDLADDEQRTITRYCEYRLIGSAA